MLLSAVGSLVLAVAAAAESSKRQETPKAEKYCSATICVEVTANGNSTLDYLVSSTGKMKDVGWIGIGFGDAMTNTPMVITWANPDGSMTLSQRETPYHAMPRVVDNPRMLATPHPQLSTLSGPQVKFAFSVPKSDRAGTQNHIYAISRHPPASSAVDATIQIHDDFGYFDVHFDKLFGPPPKKKPSNGVKQHIPSPDLAFTPHQRVILAHALFGLFGFVICLPLGAILARWLRTFTSGWMRAHWVIQIVLGGPPILMSFILAVRAVNMSEGLHFDDSHKKWGLVLFLLYFAQGIFGTFIHLVKPKNGTRPLRNYGHAILGLIVIVLSFNQVRSGYNHEWKRVTGRAPLPEWNNSAYLVWFAIVVLLYLAGLVMLKRQFRQERERRMLENETVVDMQERTNMGAL